MNTYQAAQKQSDGKWHFVRHNKRTGTHAVGYCAEDCPGHDTKEEAEAHYHEYQLDGATYNHEAKDVQHRCSVEGCDEWTPRFAQLRHSEHIFLCPKHMNRAALEELTSPSSMIMSSW